MAEEMRFLAKSDVLSFEEIELLADRFIARGVRRIRLTGGEPLVRRDVGTLIARLGARLGNGLEDLPMTTTAPRPPPFAGALRAAGIRRVNVSLDSRDPERFRYITRHGDLAGVLAGIEAAAATGLAVKINMVALKGINEDELEAMLLWCIAQGNDLTLIET